MSFCWSGFRSHHLKCCSEKENIKMNDTSCHVLIIYSHGLSTIWKMLNMAISVSVAFDPRIKYKPFSSGLIHCIGTSWDFKMYIFLFSFQEFGSEELTSIADKVVNEVRVCMWIKLASFAHVLYMFQWLCIHRFHAHTNPFWVHSLPRVFILFFIFTSLHIIYTSHCQNIEREKKWDVIQNGHSMCVSVPCCLTWN